jgi:membrane-associated protease RseP (regulator of RpoE activity)
MENLPSPVELSIALAALTEGMVDNPPSAVRQAFSVITPSGALQTLDCEVPVAVSKDHLNRDRARVLFPLRFATSGLPVEQIVVRSESWLLAPLDAIEAVQEQSLMIFTGLRKLVTGSIPLANLGGPIQIARVAGSAAEGGLLIFFITVSWMSVNIGMFNLLPLPALDGGALLMQGVEGVYGKPLPLSIQYAVQRVGIILILLLFVLVFYNDILRLIGR